MATNKLSVEQLRELKTQMQKHRSRMPVAVCQRQDDDLTIAVREHVEEFLTSTEKYFSNERDIQVRLALWLRTRQDSSGRQFYDLVDTEYGVRLAVLADGLSDIEFPEKQGARWTAPESFPWHNNLSIDLVVCKGGRWVAIELKYATRRINTESFVFGENVGTQGVLSNQATANLAMYAYWKDVRRLEVLCKRFRNVAGGLAVMVSNNSDCWNTPHDSSLYTDFSMHKEEGKEHYVGGHVLKWKDSTSDTIADGHPAFLLEGRYPCGWNQAGITARTKNGMTFKYMITNITKI